MEISKSIRYIGVNDHQIDLFEGQYKVPNGMSYNSYLILDDKSAVMDSVDVHFADQWIQNIRGILGDKDPDYFIVQHMEPDHSGSVKVFMDTFPGTTILASMQAFTMMNQFFGVQYEDRRIVVKEGSQLELGHHTLTFVTAPMVHWPEVIMTYESTEKVLFSADAFGKFGALDHPEEWLSEARRYYIGIVGKYGMQVQNVLKKASALDIKTICSLHGPVLSGDLSPYMKAYDLWSSYQPEEKGVLIAYTSVYGHTREAVMELAQMLRNNGQTVVVRDLAREDMALAVGEAFEYDRLVLATTTYNMCIYPFMQEFVEHLLERNFQNRKVGIIENGSWSPVAGKLLRKMLENSKNLTFTDTQVTIRSALNDQSRESLKALASELSE